MTSKESSRFGYSVVAAALGVQAVAVTLTLLEKPESHAKAMGFPE